MSYLYCHLLLVDKLELKLYITNRVSKTDTDIKMTDTDTIFPNYPGYTDNRYTDIY